MCIFLFIAAYLEIIIINMQISQLCEMRAYIFVFVDVAWTYINCLVTNNLKKKYG